MPQYFYECNQESGGCGHSFELECSMADLDQKEKSLKCPSCRKKKPIRRIYNATVCPSAYQPKTLGTLAEKNSRQMSADHKHALKDQYLDFKTQKNWESTKDGRMKHKDSSNAKDSRK